MAIVVGTPVAASSGAAYTNSQQIVIPDVPAGALLVLNVGTSAGTANTITGVTDNNGNAWAKVDDIIGGGKNEAMWYAPDAVGGFTTVTISSGSSYIAWTAEAFFVEGIAGTAPLDRSAFGSDSGYVQNHSVGPTAATTQNDELVVHGWAGGSTANIYSAGPGFSNVIGSNGDGTYISSGVQSKIVSTMGEQSSTIVTSEWDQGGSIIATFKAGESTPVVAPNAPTNVRAIKGDAEARLVWKATPGATGYEVERSESFFGPFESVATPASNVYIDPGRTNHTRYFYRIRATNSAGPSPVSLIVSTIPTPQVGDDNLDSSYFQWMSRFLRNDGAIVRPYPEGNNDAPDYAPSSDVTSEGQSYAMQFALQVDDRIIFDLAETFNYVTLDRRNRGGSVTTYLNLMSWHYDDVNNVVYDANSAHDADLDRMAALYWADQVWGSDGDIDYKARADAISDDLLSLMRQNSVTGNWHLPSDAAQSQNTPYEFNPSYFDPVAYKIAAANQTDPAKRAKWLSACDGDYELTAAANAHIFAPQTTTANIPPNWILFDPTTNTITSGTRGNNELYGFESVRLPYRLWHDDEFYGDPRAEAVLAGLKTHLTNAWTTLGSVKADWHHDGTLAGDYQLAIFDHAAWLTLALNDPSNATAAEIKTARIDPLFYAPGGYYADAAGSTAVSYYGLSWALYGEMTRQGVYDNYVPDPEFTGSATQSATARISNRRTRTQAARSRIQTRRTATRPARARIARRLTRTQTTRSRIAVRPTRTQPARARVANRFTRSQSATARIVSSSTLSKTQSAVARIARRFSKAQTARARIAQRPTSTQTATARLQRGLVAYWRFEGDGTEEVNGLDGAFTGGTSFVTDYRGVGNEAVEFNGTDGRFTVPNDARLNSPSWSIVTTVTVNQDLDCDAQNNWRGLLGKISGSTSGPSAGFSVILEQTRQVILRAGGAGSPGQGIRTSTALAIGQTYQLGFVYDEFAGQTRVYIDGALAGTFNFTPGTPNPASSSSLVVGGFHNTALCPNGSGGSPATVHDLRFYDEVLDEAEIAALYEPTSIATATQTARARIESTGPKHANLFRDIERFFEGDLADGRFRANRTTMMKSDEWASEGSFSVKLTPTGTDSADGFLNVGGDVNTAVLELLPGKTYKVSGDVYLPAALTGTLDPRGRGILVYAKRASTGQHSSLTHSDTPNTPGVHHVERTFRIPDDALEAFVRFYHGGYAGSGDVYWDNLSLTQVPEVGAEQSATARIAVRRTRLQSSLARIARRFSRTQPEIARVANTRSRTQSATGRILVSTSESFTQSATARIAVRRTDSQPATARISQQKTRTQPARARISTRRSRLQSSLARIARRFSRTQPGIARAANTRISSQNATGRIVVNSTESFTQSAKARIARRLVRTQQATARISTRRAVTQQARSRISTRFSKTQGAVARILQSATQLAAQTAAARIEQSRTDTQPAKSRISIVRTRTQLVVARIGQSRTNVQVSAARISQRSARTQTARARITRRLTRTQTASARLLNVRSLAQGATARVASNRTRTQQGRARISQRYAELQSATARISNNRIATQTATANLRRGLVGHWKLDGDGLDSSGNELHGTVIRGITPTEDQRRIANSAMNFDGDGYIEIADDPKLYLRDAVAIAMWVKFDATKIGQFSMIFSQLDQGYELSKDTSDRLRLRVRPESGSVATYLTNNGPLYQADRWYHVAASFDAVTGEYGLWVDGERIASGHNLGFSGKPIYNSPHSTTIGRRDASYFHRGAVDDVRLYDVALTDDEVAALYQPAVEFNKTQSATALVVTSAQNFTSQTATARIVRRLSDTQSAISRIAVRSTETQIARARIATRRTRSQSAVARIQNRLVETQSAAARIQRRLSRNSTATARIAQGRSLSQDAVARVQTRLSEVQPAVARISPQFTSTQTARARILVRRTRTQAARASIATRRSITQAARSRIVGVLSKAQSAAARIANRFTLDQQSSAQVAESRYIEQNQTARIAEPRFATQSAEARISVEDSLSQSAKARIVHQTPGGAFEASVTQPWQWSTSVSVRSRFETKIEQPARFKTRIEVEDS